MDLKRLFRGWMLAILLVFALLIVVLRVVGSGPQYTGFEIGDEFVIGYGLDYAERYRNLPFVGTLAPHAYGG